MFNPEQNINPLYKREFIAEAHKRIVTPLIIIIMTLIGALTSICGSFERKISIKKIFYSIIFAILIQIYIILTPQLIVSYSKIIPLIYLLPILTIIIILLLTTINTEKLKFKLFSKESLER